MDPSLRIPLQAEGTVYKGWLERFVDYIGGPIPSGLTNREVLIKFAEAKAFDADRRRFEKPYANRFTRLLAVQGRICAQTVLDTNGDAESTLRSLQYFDHDLRTLYHTLYQDVGEFFNRRVTARLEEQLKAKPPPYNREDPFANPAFSQWYTQTTGQKITAIGEATRIKIRADLYQGLEQGTSVQHLARDLRASYLFSQVRASRIARTEVIAASNSATHYGLATHTNAKALVREWIATLDSRTRSTHQYGSGAGGQKRKWGKPYNVGRDRLMFPGDTSLGARASEVVNCRCTEGFKRNPHLVKPPTPRPSSIPVPRVISPIENLTPANVRKQVIDRMESSGREIEGLQIHRDELLRQTNAAFETQHDSPSREAYDKYHKLLDEYDNLNEKILPRKYKQQVKEFLDIWNPTGKKSTAFKFQQDTIIKRRLPRAKLKEAQEFLENLGGLKGRKEIVINYAGLLDSEGTRAYAEGVRQLMVVPGGGFKSEIRAVIHMDKRDTVDAYIHEGGHVIDILEKNHSDKVEKFFAKRTAGEKAQKLSKIMGNTSYSAEEITKRDKWISPYQGRVYEARDVSNTFASEVTSMTVQMLYENPWKVAKQDPDLFDFFWGVFAKP